MTILWMAEALSRDIPRGPSSKMSYMKQFVALAAFFRQRNPNSQVLILKTVEDTNYVQLNFSHENLWFALKQTNKKIVFLQHSITSYNYLLFQLLGEEFWSRYDKRYKSGYLLLVITDLCMFYLQKTVHYIHNPPFPSLEFTHQLINEHCNPVQDGTETASHSATSATSHFCGSTRAIN